jgi:NitT/TauT family transport system substrate-binding protein
MSHKSPFRVLAAALVVVALTLTGCTAEPQSTTGKLTVGLTYQPDIQFAPFYVAEAQGWFTEAGVDIELRHHGSSETLFGALDAGTEQVVFSGGDEQLQAHSQGSDVVAIATVYREYPVVLIVPEDSAITGPEDLRGKKIGLPGPFGENWFGLLVLLQDAGLTQDDVEVMNIGYTQQAALMGGDVDAVIGFKNNDLVRFGAADFPVRAIELTGSGQPPLVGAGLGTSSKVIKDQSVDLKAMIKVLRRGLQFCIDEPEKAVELSADYVPTLSDADQRAAALVTLNATIPLYGSADDLARLDVDRWTAMSAFMETAGLLAEPVDASAATDTSIAG